VCDVRIRHDTCIAHILKGTSMPNSSLVYMYLILYIRYTHTHAHTHTRTHIHHTHTHTHTHTHARTQAHTHTCTLFENLLAKCPNGKVLYVALPPSLPLSLHYPSLSTTSPPFSLNLSLSPSPSPSPSFSLCFSLSLSLSLSLSFSVSDEIPACLLEKVWKYRSRYFLAACV
jgi:hypothetical protein